VKQTHFVQNVTNKIDELGLTAPAILLLEAHKPLSFITSQLLLVAQPLLDVFLPQNLTRNLADLFANSNQVERLITNLELNITRETGSGETG